MKNSNNIIKRIPLLILTCLSLSFSSCGMGSTPKEDDKTCKNHIDNNSDHYCDNCYAKVSEHVDSDKDHKCDICSRTLTDHKDSNYDHKCDMCNEVISEHIDKNSDHYCEICREKISEHIDNNKDHKCDICSSKLSEHIDENEDYVCDYCAEELPRPLPYLDTHKYGNTIRYSNAIKNKISNRYEDISKHTYIIENSNMGIKYDMFDKKQISSLYNKTSLKSYVTDSFEPYVILNNQKYYANNSSTSARNNTYDMGYYYYNTHIMNQSFGKVTDGVTSFKNLLSQSNIASTNDVTNVNVSGGVLSFDVTSSYDPQINFKANYDASSYNYLHVRIKSQTSGSFVLYMASSIKGLCAEQSISFKLPSKGEFVDCYLDLTTMPNYGDTIKNLRIDIGATGEHIEISKFEVFKANEYSSIYKLDRSYHVYGDKLYENISVLSSLDNQTFPDAGYEIKIDKSKVTSYELVSSTEKSVSTNNNDKNNRAIAFIIKDVGVFGIILPYDKPYALGLNEENGNYVITIYPNLGHPTLNQKEGVTYGFRIYTDSEDNFEKFRNEYYIENNPLSPSIFEVTDNAHFIEYNSLKGSYEFGADGKDMNYVFYKNPHFTPRINAEFTSIDNREIYMCGYTNNYACIEGAAMLDEDDLMLPIPVEVCKNFQGEKEEPFFDKDDTFYAKTIAPISLKRDDKIKLSMLHLYQKWGNYDLKQISSIKYYTEYYHLSTGTTETNCIAPEAYNYLPDFRSMSAPFWEGQPQHTSYGSNDFLVYKDSSGNSVEDLHTYDTISSSGPTYADADLHFITSDNKIDATYRHIEMPSSDENRTYYEIDLKVLDNLSINDFKNNFAIFSSNSINKSYTKYGYLDASNKQVIEEKGIDSDYSSSYILGKDNPYFDMFNCVNSNDYVNLGILIKSGEFKINGNKVSPNFYVNTSFNKTSKTNNVKLSLNLGDVTLKKGDYLSFKIIYVPWGSQLSEDDSNMRALRENTLLNPFETKVTTGSIIKDSYIPKIKIDDKSNSAIFTISKGFNVVTPRIYGFKNISKPIVYELVNNNWEVYTYNYYDFDGYTVFMEEDETFSYTFPVELENKADNARTFKIVLS